MKIVEFVLTKIFLFFSIWTFAFDESKIGFFEKRALNLQGKSKITCATF